MRTTIQTWYDFILQQMAAESYLDQSSIFGGTQNLPRVLMYGSNNPIFQQQQVNEPTTDLLPGATRLTATQAEDFLSRYEVVSHLPNTASGFSGTLMREIATGAYTLAFRSTEFFPAEQGGDRTRDFATNFEIARYGFAFGQIASMESYYEHLKLGQSYNATNGQWESDPGLDDFRIRFGFGGVGGSLNVSGYSLSGNLVNVFTALHPEVDHAYAFNATGMGNIGRGDLGTMVANLRFRLDAARINVSDPGATSIYDRIGQPDLYAQYQRIAEGLQLTYNTSYTIFGSAPLFDSRITQLYGFAAHNDSLWVANTGLHVPATMIFIEDQPNVQNWVWGGDSDNDFGTTHSITLMADSLAVMSVFEKLGLDMSLSEGLDTAYKMLAAGTAEQATGFIGFDGVAERDSLESIVAGLHKLIVGSKVTLISDPSVRGFSNLANRDQFYLALDAINEKISEAEGALNLESLVDKTANDLTLAATNPDPTDAWSIAYRYALKHLNPFAVKGMDYQTSFNAGGELDLYDWNSHTGNLTQQWIDDRAQFLYFKNIAFRGDRDLVAIPGLDDQLFVDIAQSFQVYTTSVEGNGEAPSKPSDPPRFVFGGDQPDMVEGGDKADRLYGGAGGDLLAGGKGDDYLEGGAGLDIYQYGASESIRNSNDGNDTILDTDGKGLLRYTYDPGLFSSKWTSIIADASIKASSTEWRSGDGRFTYRQEGTDLRVTANTSAGGSMLLKNWQDGDFRIHLGRARAVLVAPPVTTRDILGDMQPIDFDANAEGVQVQLDDLGNVIGVGADPDRQDTLHDSSGNDQIISGGGNDTILATRGGHDWIDSGTGDDDVISGAGADWIFAGGGNDTVSSSDDDDYVSGGAGRDRIVAGAGADIIEAGDDGVSAGDAGGDIVDAGDGDDSIYGGSLLNIDTAIARGDDDDPSGRKGDYIYGGTGDDWLVTGSGDDVLNGGPGNDLIVSGAGNDVIDGDLIAYATQLNWSLSRVIVRNGEYLDYQVTTIGEETPDNQSINDGGNDTVYAGKGDDVVYGRGGDDFVDAGSGNNYVFGGSGDDTVLGGDGNDYLDGDSGPSTPTGLAGNDYLDGGAGNDTLVGEGGDDILFGGSGDDVLSGGDGNDLVSGGPGTDVLIGGAGKDTYVFNRGDGVETIFDLPSGSQDPEASVIVLADILRSQVTFRLGSLMLDFGQGDAIHFDGFDPDDPLSTPMLDSIWFADGTSMTYHNLLDQGFDIDGTEGNENSEAGQPPMLVGTAVTDRIGGLGGNDVLVGLGGDDILNGGAGADFLQGGAGNDTYLVDAADTVFDTEGLNSITFTDGTTVDNVQIVRGVSGTSQYLVLVIGGHQFLAINPDQPAFNAFTFSGGEHFTYDELLGRRFFEARSLAGGDGDDVLIGYAGDDFLNGNGGNDTLLGYGGNDILAAGTGNDVLDGGKGNDTLQGQAGEDVYVFGYSDGFDIITDDLNSPDNTNVIRWKSEVRPEDVLIGRNDNINSAEGSLSFILGGYPDQAVVENWYPNGQSLILDEYTNQVAVKNWFVDGSNKFIRVEFADGTQWGAEELLGKLAVSTEGKDYLVGTASNDTLAGLGGDDQIWGDAGNDTLYGGDGKDFIRGGLGDDFIVGGAGNDILVGKGGNDVYWFDVGFGQDIVNDFDEDSDGLHGTNDVVRFAPGIAPQDVTLTQDPDTYITFSLNGTTDRIFLPPEFVGDQGRIERVEFADGTVWDETVLFQYLFPGNDILVGTEGGDSIDGAGGNDSLFGLGGDDTLVGGWGNDVLEGGTGNDILYGYTGDDVLDGGVGDDMLFGGTGLESGTGNDTYVFGRGYGVDTIYDYYAAGANLDTIELAADILPGDITVTRSSGNTADLVVSINGAADKLIVQNWFVSDAYKIEQLKFSDGTIWSDAQLTEMSQQVNHAPTLANAIADQTALEDTAFNFQVPPNAFADVDAGDTFRYTASLVDGTALPTWLDFNSSTGSSRGTPANEDVGILLLRVTATDGSGLSASGAFQLTVTNVNDAPVAVTDISRSVQEGTEFLELIADAFWDPDLNDVLIYSAKRADGLALPAWLTIDAQSGIVSGTPGASDIGYTGIEITATDSGGLGASTYFGLTVTPWPDLALTGTAGADTLTGHSGNDTLNGLGGVDVMIGDYGNDTYFVDNSNDVVIEQINQGDDIVFSSVTFALGADVENLTLTGSRRINGIGNEQSNRLVGNGNANTLTGGAGDDFLDGGAGSDILIGGTGNDTYIVDRAGDKIVENAGEGIDTVLSAVSFTLGANIENLLLTGLAAATAKGNALANLLVGNAAFNILFGETGNDILQGMEGDDALRNSSGATLLDGGAGADSLTGHSSRELFIGGAGDDTITTGKAADMIAFNAGDGRDIIIAGGGTDNTVSLGCGIRYEDLALSRVGNGLVLAAGGSDQMTFSDWYLRKGKHSVLNLQVIAEAMAGYNPASSDTLLDNKVETFDFAALATAFDAAGQVNGWALTNALLSAHLSGSDNEAIGGDLAYQYGLNGNLTGIGLTQAQDVLNAPGFGSAAQTLRPVQELQQGQIRLS